MANEGSEQKSKTTEVKPSQNTSVDQSENGSFLADLMIFFGVIFFIVASVCLIPELDYSILGAAFIGVGAICFSIGIFSKTNMQDFSTWLAKLSKAERIGILILGVIIASAFLVSSGLVFSSLANTNIGVFTSFLSATNLGVIPAMAIGAAALVYGIVIIATSWVAYSKAEDIYQAEQKEIREEVEEDDSSIIDSVIYQYGPDYTASLSSIQKDNKKDNKNESNLEAKAAEDAGETQNQRSEPR